MIIFPFFRIGITSLDAGVQQLVEYIYSEASAQLSADLGETQSLGILSIEQIEKGEALLLQISQELNEPTPNGKFLFPYLLSVNTETHPSRVDNKSTIGELLFDDPTA